MVAALCFEAVAGLVAPPSPRTHFASHRTNPARALHRSEEELDPVSLHNSALAQMASDPGGGFKKLNHLLGTGARDQSFACCNPV